MNAHQASCELRRALAVSDPALQHVERWGAPLARRLLEGGRLLVAGNGGSAAEAQHLTAELVGRFERERLPLSALALHAETSSVTAIANDYGFEQAFARQVRAHGRPGDVLLLLSTSGRSPNVVAAARAAVELGLATYALTGAGSSPLTACCDDVVAVPSSRTATIQELHLLCVHVLCSAIDHAIAQEVDPDRPHALPPPVRTRRSDGPARRTAQDRSTTPAGGPA